MNRLLKKNPVIPTAFLLLSLGIGSATQAQTTAAPPPPPGNGSPVPGNVPPPLPSPAGGAGTPLRPLPADRPDRAGWAAGGRPAPDERMRGGLQAVTTFNGTVARLSTNDDFIYDGFTLQSSTDSFHVHFPPNMGQTIQKSVKKGSTVIVKGAGRTAPDGVEEIELVSLSSNGTVIEVQPEAAPPVPVAPAFTKGSGRITGLVTDREGRVNALVLNDKEVLRLPSAVFTGLSQPPAVGTTVAYTGLIRALEAGALVQGDTKIIQARTITLNGQQFLVGPR